MDKKEFEKKDKQLRKKEDDTWKKVILTTEYNDWKDNPNPIHTSAMKATKEWQDWVKALNDLKTLPTLKDDK